jgi:hypothetical protein
MTQGGLEVVAGKMKDALLELPNRLIRLEL